MIQTNKSSADRHDLYNYLPNGFDNIFSLNAYAGIKDNSARHKLLKSPYQFAPIGKKIGVGEMYRAKKPKPFALNPA